MTTREAMYQLEQRGIRLSYWTLRGMIVRDEVPKPRMNTSLAYDWTEEDLRNVEQAVAACRKESA